jgi:hypothetical protein
MRIVTRSDLAQFSAVLVRIHETAADMARLSRGAACIVAYEANSGNAPAAAGFGVSAIAGFAKILDELLAKFEQEADRCLGEKRRPYESPEEFMVRIAESDMVALAERNGVRIKETTC